MTTEKDGFILYKSHYEAIKNLSLEDKGLLCDAIFQYQINGIELDLPPVVQMAFFFIKKQFDLNDDKYKKTIEKNQENGKKGGRPKGSFKKPKKPKKPSGFHGDECTETDCCGYNEEKTQKPKKADNDIRYKIKEEEEKKINNKKENPVFSGEENPTEKYCVNIPELMEYTKRLQEIYNKADCTPVTTALISQVDAALKTVSKNEVLMGYINEAEMDLPRFLAVNIQCYLAYNKQRGKEEWICKNLMNFLSPNNASNNIEHNWILEYQQLLDKKENDRQNTYSPEDAFQDSIDRECSKTNSEDYVDVD